MDKIIAVRPLKAGGRGGWRLGASSFGIVSLFLAALSRDYGSDIAHYRYELVW
jgi:hypothetical protein